MAVVNERYAHLSSRIKECNELLALSDKELLIAMKENPNLVMKTNGPYYERVLKEKQELWQKNVANVLNGIIDLPLDELLKGGKDGILFLIKSNLKKVPEKVSVAELLEYVPVLESDLLNIYRKDLRISLKNAKQDIEKESITGNGFNQGSHPFFSHDTFVG
ncbi:MAG: hypothetical protein WCO55_01655 [Candidatus Falkowbacteria bacterium]